MNDHYPIHTIDSAPEGSRAGLEATQKQLRMIPNLIGTMAGSPQLLNSFNELTRVAHSLTLPPLEREVVSLVVGLAVGCTHCIAFHTMTMQRLRAPESLVRALKTNAPVDARLSALRDFAREVVQQRGEVPDDVQQRFFAAGFTPQHALEVVFLVAMLTMTMYTSRLARVPLDGAFAALAS